MLDGVGMILGIQKYGQFGKVMVWKSHVSKIAVGTGVTTTGGAAYWGLSTRRLSENQKCPSL